ncbi:MAG: hypothetical protein KAH44_24545 [Oricola sp.]|nr:hypothetical protein [Oricola sp.]
MLARRFTIVCLVAGIAGGWFAMLVQENARSPHTWRTEALRVCPFGVTPDCLRLIN